MNALRALVGLPALIEHDFNRYLKKGNLEGYLQSLGVAYEIVDFCSVYYLGSRFLRELVTNPADYPGYSNPSVYKSTTSAFITKPSYRLSPNSILSSLVMFLAFTRLYGPDTVQA